MQFCIEFSKYLIERWTMRTPAELVVILSDTGGKYR
jgi:hypothetical protein